MNLPHEPLAAGQGIDSDSTARCRYCRNVLGARLLVALLAFCAWTDDLPAADRPPNIVYIMADDLGYAELGCYGQTKIETPHIDRLAEEGMRFTQHYTRPPLCAQPRCTLMTGNHRGHAIVRSNLAQLPPEYP